MYVHAFIRFLIYLAFILHQPTENLRWIEGSNGEGFINDGALTVAASCHCRTV